MPDYYYIVPEKAVQAVRSGEDEEDVIVPTFVNAGETLTVQSGELLQQCTVRADGTLHVEAGATVETLLVEPGAWLWVDPGCSISGLLIEVGGRANGFVMHGRSGPHEFSADESIGLHLGTVYVEDGIEAFFGAGQKAETIRVQDGGNLVLLPGASVNTSLVVEIGGSVNGFTARVKDYHLNDKVSPLVIDCSEMLDDELKEYFVIMPGYTAHCYGGQTITACSVPAAGGLYIESQGTVAGLEVVEDAALWVESGSTVSGLHAEAGSTINGFTLLQDNSPADFDGNDEVGLVLADVYVDLDANAVLGTGQSVNDCTVQSGGHILLKSGASVNGTFTIYAGATLNGLTVLNDVTYDPDKINPLVIECFTDEDNERKAAYLLMPGDTAYCHDGQTVVDCIVPQGSTFVVGAGSILKGDMSLVGQIVQDGAIDASNADLDIRLEAFNEPNDAAFIQTPVISFDTFSVTIADDQAIGRYLLADGLDEWYAGDITVKNTDDAVFATLSMDGDLLFEPADKDYVLGWISLEDGQLSFSLDDFAGFYLVATAYVKDNELHFGAKDKICLKNRQYRFNEAEEWQTLSGQSIALPQDSSDVFLRCEGYSGLTTELHISMDDLSAVMEDGCVAPFTLAYTVDFDDSDLQFAARLADGSALSFANDDRRLSLYALSEGISITAANAAGKEVFGDGIAVEPVSKGRAPKQFTAGTVDGVTDIFIARVSGQWGHSFIASHAGSLVNGEAVGVVDGATVNVGGRNRIVDVFAGAGDDSCILLLTNDANGDVLFVDDIYSKSFEDVGKTQSRLANITEIVAGAGDDIIDFTSGQFEYAGAGVTVHGGAGDDVIWSNKGSNLLFGDEGNDWLIGGVGDDVLVGGVGDDILDGNGGDDIFCFGAGWGNDEVQQAAGGKAILWFAEGLEVTQSGRVFTCGGDSVTVSEGAEVEIRIGEDAKGKYAQLCSLGAFC